MSDYVYKKIGTLNEPEFKVNVYGIISSVVKLQKPTLSGKLHSQLHIVDETCREDFVLHIFCAKEDDVPKELQVYKIVRIHRMKVERYFDKLDGRIFKGQDVVVFEPDENSSAFYTTAKIVTMTDNDKGRVNELRKWMKECDRFRCAFQVRDSELCDVKGEKVFNLFCKLTNIRLFPEHQALVLTVVDATKCPELLYKVPDNWSGTELPQDFYRDASQVDIVFNQGEEYCETIKTGDFCKLWNVRSVKCDVSITNEASAYKLVMVKDEGSIYTVPYGVGKTIVLQRTLERGPNEDCTTDSEIEISLQNKMKSFSVSSSEDSAVEDQQKDNSRNVTSSHQKNCSKRPEAADSKHSVLQTQNLKSEETFSPKNHKVSALGSSMKSDSVELNQLLRHASTSEQHNICEIQHHCLSGSDTDIQVLPVIPQSPKRNAVSLQKTSNHCFSSHNKECKSVQKDLSSLSDHLRASHILTDRCSNNDGIKRKLVGELSRTVSSDVCLNKRNCKAIWNKMEMTNCEDEVISHVSSQQEFVISYKTLKMWRDTFPTLFNIEEVVLTADEVKDKDTKNNCESENVQRVDVFLIDVRPPLSGDAMDMVSGYCQSGCHEMYLHSTLIMDNRNKIFLCPSCNKQGLRSEVQLMLFVELVVMNTLGIYMNVFVCGKQAETFFGCSVQQYMCNISLRSSIVKTLLLFTVKKNISMGCLKVPIINLRVSLQENKYFLINTKLKNYIKTA